MTTPLTATPEKVTSRETAPVAWKPLLLLAAAKLAVHLPLASRYGFHRDEFYYIMGGRNPAWGYVDHPPLTPLVAGFIDLGFGPSLFALRAVPALLGAVLLVMAGLMAREMGARGWGQTIAGVAVLATPIFLMTHHLFQTIIFDQIAWAAATLVVLRIVRTEDDRLWLLVGAVAGVGLLAKYTMALFGLALVIGLLVTPHRRHFRSPWLWAGGAVALLVVLPNLIWQMNHGWPTLEFVRNNNARVAEEFSTAGLLGIQAAFMGIAILPLFAAGVGFLFGKAGARFRIAGWIWLVATVVLLALGGKPYYPVAAWPAIFAAGAVAAELLAERRAWRRMRTVVPVILVAFTLPIVWVGLPVMPRETFARHQDKFPHKELNEQFGWDEFVSQVAAVYHALPEEDRERAGLMTDSYGEAGALDVLGRRYGLPPAASAHNNYYFWGPPDAEILVAVAWSPRRLERVFAEVEAVGNITNSHGVRNESSSQTIYICRRPLRPWPEIWEYLRFFV